MSTVINPETERERDVLRYIELDALETVLMRLLAPQPGWDDELSRQAPARGVLSTDVSTDDIQLMEDDRLTSSLWPADEYPTLDEAPGFLLAIGRTRILAGRILAASAANPAYLNAAAQLEIAEGERMLVALAEGR